MMFIIALSSLSDAFRLRSDPETAQTLLFLYENRIVTWVGEKQPYPDHPERFEPSQCAAWRESDWMLLLGDRVKRTGSCRSDI